MNRSALRATVTTTSTYRALEIGQREFLKRMNTIPISSLLNDLIPKDPVETQTCDVTLCGEPFAALQTIYRGGPI
jgi:hypothetical protein